jgi:hypothetical protein
MRIAVAESCYLLASGSSLFNKITVPIKQSFDKKPADGLRDGGTNPAVMI